MAKKSKGEVGFVSDGDTSKREVRFVSNRDVSARASSFTAGDKTYTMIFSINALCELENDFEDPVAEFNRIMSGDVKKRLQTTRKIFRAGLSDYHPEMTEKQAGLLMTALGQQAFVIMADAFTLAFSESAGSPKSEGDGEHPLERQSQAASIGSTS
jgi:hypothetical protein